MVWSRLIYTVRRDRAADARSENLPMRVGDIRALTGLNVYIHRPVLSMKLYPDDLSVSAPGDRDDARTHGPREDARRERAGSFHLVGRLQRPADWENR